jgi:integrase/recombinase XerD
MRAVIRRKQHVLRKKPHMPVRVAHLDPSAPNPLHAYKREFVDWTCVIGLSPQTAAIRERGLDTFIRWCDERGLHRPQDITRPILQRYQRHLFHYRKADGEPLAYSTQATLLQPLRAFFKWLTVDNHILYNPAADLEIPRQIRQLPKLMLSVEQVEAILAIADVTTPMGIRNRAVLETFYSTGIRRAELMQLKLYDVDTKAGILVVRQGKGRKDRVVPIGERACRWLDKYREDVRPMLVVGLDGGHLFVTDYGEPYQKNRLSDMVKRHVRAAGFPHGSCHAFRHAMATHMLTAGCDIRHIQVILGHSALTTTQIYTHVSIQQLKDIHTATHPARLGRSGRAQTYNAPTTPPLLDNGQEAALQTFLATLDAEADDC